VGVYPAPGWLLCGAVNYSDALNFAIRSMRAVILVRRSPMTRASSGVMPRNVAFCRPSFCSSRRACISRSSSSMVGADESGGLGYDNQFLCPVAPVLGHLRRHLSWRLGS